MRRRLSDLRHDLLHIRRTLAPTRDAARRVIDDRVEVDTGDLFPHEVELHFGDTYDKLLRATEGLESARDLIAGVRDYHQSKVANDQNEVMKRLTVDRVDPAAADLHRRAVRPELRPHPRAALGAGLRVLVGADRRHDDRAALVLPPEGLDRPMSAPLEFAYLLSATSVDQLPDTNAEVAFVGRSNVGKSSLLNVVARRKSLANVSKTPGRTQTLNCFARRAATRPSSTARATATRPRRRRPRASWQPMIERYLLERDELTMILVLVDGEIGPTKLDVQMLDWLRTQRAAAHRGRDEARQGAARAARQAQARGRGALHARAVRRRLGERDQADRRRPPARSRAALARARRVSA